MTGPNVDMQPPIPIMHSPREQPLAQVAKFQPLQQHKLHHYWEPS